MGFYSEVDHAILVEMEGEHFTVVHSGTEKQARTLLPGVPDKQYVENFKKPEKSKKLKDGESYYSLQAHIDMINETGNEIADEWQI